MIKGIVQKFETNTYGYTTYWVSGTRYGAEAKGAAVAAVGDLIEFESFEKPGKDGKTWPTIKKGTISVVPPQPGSTAVVGNGGSAVATSGSQLYGKDAYWDAKDKYEREVIRPGILYFAGLERAILFVDLAIRTKCFDALDKAKATDKLEVLEAFVNEQTQRFVDAANTPAANDPTIGELVAAVEQVEGITSDKWS